MSTMTGASYDAGTDTLTITGTGLLDWTPDALSVRCDGWNGSESIPGFANGGNNGAAGSATVTDTQITVPNFNGSGGHFGASGQWAIGLVRTVGGTDEELGWAVIDLGGAPTGVTDPWWNHYANPLTGEAGTVDANGSHPVPSSSTALLQSIIPGAFIDAEVGTIELQLWPHRMSVDPNGQPFDSLQTVHTPNGQWRATVLRTDKVTPSGQWWRVHEYAHIGADDAVDRVRYVQVTGDLTLPDDGSAVGTQPGDIVAGHVTLRADPQHIAVRDRYGALVAVLDATSGSVDFAPDAGKDYAVRDRGHRLLGAIDRAGVFTTGGT